MGQTKSSETKLASESQRWKDPSILSCYFDGHPGSYLTREHAQLARPTEDGYAVAGWVFIPQTARERGQKGPGLFHGLLGKVDQFGVYLSPSRTDGYDEDHLTIFTKTQDAVDSLPVDRVDPEGVEIASAEVFDGYFEISTLEKVPIGEWFHLCVSYDFLGRSDNLYGFKSERLDSECPSISVYINGEIDVVCDLPGQLSLSKGDFLIGSAPTGLSFKGLVGNMMFLSEPISDSRALEMARWCPMPRPVQGEPAANVVLLGNRERRPASLQPSRKIAPTDPNQHSVRRQTIGPDAGMPIVDQASTSSQQPSSLPTIPKIPPVYASIVVAMQCVVAKYSSSSAFDKDASHPVAKTEWKVASRYVAAYYKFVIGKKGVWKGLLASIQEIGDLEERATSYLHDIAEELKLFKAVKISKHMEKSLESLSQWKEKFLKSSVEIVQLTKEYGESVNDVPNGVRRQLYAIGAIDDIRWFWRTTIDAIDSEEFPHIKDLTASVRHSTSKDEWNVLLEIVRNNTSPDTLEKLVAKANLERPPTYFRGSQKSLTEKRTTLESPLRGGVSDEQREEILRRASEILAARKESESRALDQKNEEEKKQRSNEGTGAAMHGSDGAILMGGASVARKGIESEAQEVLGAGTGTNFTGLQGENGNLNRAEDSAVGDGDKTSRAEDAPIVKSDDGKKGKKKADSKKERSSKRQSLQSPLRAQVPDEVRQKHREMLNSIVKEREERAAKEKAAQLGVKLADQGTAESSVDGASPKNDKIEDDSAALYYRVGDYEGGPLWDYTWQSPTSGDILVEFEARCAHSAVIYLNAFPSIAGAIRIVLGGAKKVGGCDVQYWSVAIMPDEANNASGSGSEDQSNPRLIWDQPTVVAELQSTANARRAEVEIGNPLAFYVYWIQLHQGLLRVGRGGMGLEKITVLEVPCDLRATVCGFSSGSDSTELRNIHISDSADRKLEATQVGWLLQDDLINAAICKCAP